MENNDSYMLFNFLYISKTGLNYSFPPSTFCYLLLNIHFGVLKLVKEQFSINKDMNEKNNYVISNRRSKHLIVTMIKNKCTRKSQKHFLKKKKEFSLMNYWKGLAYLSFDSI